MKFNYFKRFGFSMLLGLLLFSSCEDDEVDTSSFDVSQSTWGLSSTSEVTAGITLEFEDNTFTYTVVNYDGASQIVRGTFSSSTLYDVILSQEDGDLFARGIEKDEYLEIEFTTSSDDFQDHDYITTSSSSELPTVDLEQDVEGEYVAVPNDLSIEIGDTYKIDITTYQEVTLSWDSVSDATQYRIYQEIDPDSDINTYVSLRNDDGRLSNVAYTVSTDTMVVLPQESATSECNYFVVAYSNNEALGAPAWAYKMNEYDEATPDNLDYQIEDAAITLTWDANWKCESYNVYQKTGDNYELSTSLSASESAETESISLDIDLITEGSFTTGEEYTFVVTGVTEAGVESSASAAVTVSYFDQVVNISTYFDSEGIQYLYWDKVDGASYYYVIESASTDYSDIDEDGDSYIVSTEEATYEDIADDLNLTDYKNHNLFVVAASTTYAADALNGYASDVVTYTYFPTPSGLSQSNNYLDNEYTLTWDENSDADSYIVAYTYLTYSEMSSGDEHDFANKTIVSSDVAYSEDGYIIDMSAMSYGEFKFYVQANGNETISDAATTSSTYLPAPNNFTLTYDEYSSEVTFEWDREAIADGYTISYTHLTFEEVEDGIYSHNFDNSTTIASGIDYDSDGYIVNMSTYESGEYYFYLQSEKDGSLGDASEVLTLNYLTAPTISSYSFNSSISTETVIWNADDDADQYILSYSFLNYEDEAAGEEHDFDSKTTISNSISYNEDGYEYNMDGNASGVYRIYFQSKKDNTTSEVATLNDIYYVATPSVSSSFYDNITNIATLAWGEDSNVDTYTISYSYLTNDEVAAGDEHSFDSSTTYSTGVSYSEDGLDINMSNYATGEYQFYITGYVGNNNSETSKFSVLNL